MGLDIVRVGGLGGWGAGRMGGWVESKAKWCEYKDGVRDLSKELRRVWDGGTMSVCNPIFSISVIFVSKLFGSCGWAYWRSGHRVLCHLGSLQRHSCPDSGFGFGVLGFGFRIWERVAKCTTIGRCVCAVVVFSTQWSWEKYIHALKGGQVCKAFLGYK